MDESAGGRSASLSTSWTLWTLRTFWTLSTLSSFTGAPRARSGEDVKGHSLLAFDDEALCLQVEHRAIPAAFGHELVVGAELDHTAVLEHADSIRQADGGEAVRDENRGAVAGGSEKAAEDLRFAPHIELRGRLI